VGQARALRHLVAAAVPGMSPDDVAVIDTVAGLVPGENDDPGSNSVAAARAAEIRGNIERLLEARVGVGKAIVEVAVDIVTERESIVEKRFDPQGRVAISQETEERSGSSTNPGGDVTVASNLPDGDAATGGNGKSENTETREQVNYEVSETQREVLRAPGAVRKISVAVLVDGQAVTAADGTAGFEPRPETELAVLRELVASSFGLDEARGDVLTIKSLAFQPPNADGDLLEAGLLSGLGPIDTMGLIQIVVLALVALVLGLFVIRPILSAQPRRTNALPSPGVPLALPGAGTAERAFSSASPEVLTGEIEDSPGLSIADGYDAANEKLDPVARLRRLIEERQAESVEILRGWMEHEEERT
jgi:flagellar M-ring protein FliF